MIYNEKKVETLRQRYPEGTRICLDSMDNDPRPIHQVSRKNLKKSQKLRVLKNPKKWKCQCNG